MKDNYAVNYAAAMVAATAELDSLFEEARVLRNRMEQIDTVITALKPLMPETESGYGHDLHSDSMKQRMDAALSLAVA
ncbi:MAG TPA: hypothetical protein VGF82_21085 [Terracidiphilus sp.]|jgi:hypothetical protein